VGKPTVINFFINRAINNETLTVYEPGTQARNFIHVMDVEKAYVQSAERLLKQLEHGVTGTETYEIAGEEDMSVMTVAEIVRDTAKELFGAEVPIELVENPRSAETMVKEFSLDISTAKQVLGWEPSEKVTESVQQLLNEKHHS
jgi:UDP-glucose 4-epimerase